MKIPLYSGVYRSLYSLYMGFSSYYLEYDTEGIPDL